MRAFVVMCDVGEYSDKDSWPVAVADTQEAAERAEADMRQRWELLRDACKDDDDEWDDEVWMGDEMGGRRWAPGPRRGGQRACVGRAYRALAARPATLRQRVEQQPARIHLRRAGRVGMLARAAEAPRVPPRHALRARRDHARQTERAGQRLSEPHPRRHQRVAGLVDAHAGAGHASRQHTASLVAEASRLALGAGPAALDADAAPVPVARHVDGAHREVGRLVHDAVPADDEVDAHRHQGAVGAPPLLHVAYDATRAAGSVVTRSARPVPHEHLGRRDGALTRATLPWAPPRFRVAVHPLGARQHGAAVDDAAGPERVDHLGRGELLVSAGHGVPVDFCQYVIDKAYVVTYILSMTTATQELVTEVEGELVNVDGESLDARWVRLSRLERQVAGAMRMHSTGSEDEQALSALFQRVVRFIHEAPSC